MSDTQPTPKPVDDMSFEEALRELETIVQKLERGDVPLQESIAQYERGDKLRSHCDKLLQAAEAKVEKLRRGNDGTASGTEPLDVS
ncbi:exodeoxyribonuclease VII small subunit [Breoghania sp.]|uniref:exodeoxyribonuclease VII small subunit n=1 Tax=Breoghania sp. TaxID=2065378 RepID=UPI00262E219C|nr:exodeoxyribonuclease VII small subunit [Breoghania sp.]MDJ0932363.1 exodeoxyribonuclease VII small subunit [Breoghania sp.]